MPRTLPILALAALAGCVSAERDNDPPPSPASVRPATVMIVADNFRDTDSSGYLDSAQVVVYIFGDDPRYPLPLATAGAFAFTLSDQSGAVLAEWSLPPEKAEELRRTLPAGPGFVFDLDLRQVASERLAQTEGFLTCIYTPPDHPALRTGPTAPLRVGVAQTR
jgi:hypothetical protein